MSPWSKLPRRAFPLAGFVIAGLLLTLGAWALVPTQGAPHAPLAAAAPADPDAPGSPYQAAEDPQSAPLPVYNPLKNGNQFWDIPVHFSARTVMVADPAVLGDGNAGMVETAPRQLELELYDRAGVKQRAIKAWHPLRYEAVAVPRPTDPGPRLAAGTNPDRRAGEADQAGQGREAATGDKIDAGRQPAEANQLDPARRPAGVDQLDPHKYDPYHHIRNSGDGHLFIPYDPRVSSVRIVDYTLGGVGGVELGRVSLEGAARRYCAEKPASTFCRQRVPSATLFFAPYSTTVGAGEVFTLELKARKMVGLYGGQLAVTYDANIIKLVDLDPSRPGAQVRPGDFPKPDEVLRNAANNTTGRLEYYFTLTGEKPGVTGTGTVAYLQLRANAPGQTLLRITETVMSDPQSLRIPTTSENALVTVLDAPLVTVNGQVELERRPTSAGAMACSVAGCTSTDAAGRFTLRALAGRPLQVTHPSYLRTLRMVPVTATGTLNWPKVKLLSGDFDKDDRVEIVDAAMIGQRFNLRYNAAVPDPRWLKACDITDDDVINILDMVGVQFNMLKTAPLPWPGALAQAQAQATGGGQAAGEGQADEVDGLRVAGLTGIAGKSLNGDWQLPALGPRRQAASNGPEAGTAGAPDRRTSSGASAAPTMIRLTPAKSQVDGLQADVPLDVVVEDVAKLYGYRVRIRFDPKQLMVMDLGPNEEGVQSAVGEFLDPINSFVLMNRADNTAGTVDLSVTQTAPATGKDGSGVLGTITFRGRAGGTSQVALEEVVLVDDTLPVPGTIVAQKSDATVTVANALLKLFVPRLVQRQ